MSGTIRLDRLIANLGYGSRNEVQALVRNERVLLDGAPIKDAGGRIALTPDIPTRITVDGEPLDPLPGLVVMLNKPVGVTCSHKESGPLVYDLLPPRWRRRDPAISTVGRLDKETSGLLLMTDDGVFLHQIISPKKNIAKYYVATLARPLRGDEAELFASGTMMLDGETKPLAPARLEVLSENEARVVVTEGRYHQVRRMFAATGNHVEALHRERVGNLVLPPELKPSEAKLLTRIEVETLF